jgi:RNA polymerase sigma-70 factor (ECF subfamily)
MEDRPTAEGGQCDLPQASDAELIRRAREGHRDSFDQLVLRHQRRVYSIARRMTGDHDEADDLSQDTFLAVYRSMDRFDERQSFAAYISRIAINLSINHLRHRKRWLKIQTRGEEKAVGAEGNGPQEQMEKKENLDRLNEAIQSLPPDQKAVLVLKVYQEYSYKEIAATLKVSMGTVMSRLHRARSCLRAQLKDVL